MPAVMRAAVDHNIGVPRQPGNGDAVKQRRHGKPVGQAADGGAFGRVAGNLPGRMRQPAGGVQRFQRQQAAGSQAERGATAMAGQPVSQWGGGRAKTWPGSAQDVHRTVDQPVGNAGLAGQLGQRVQVKPAGGF